MRCKICGKEINGNGSRRLMYYGDVCSECANKYEKQINKVYETVFSGLFGYPLRKKLAVLEWEDMIMKILKVKNGNKKMK